MSKFIHPTRFLKTQSLENKNCDKKPILTKIIIISLIVGLVGGIIGQSSMNYLDKKTYYQH